MSFFNPKVFGELLPYSDTLPEDILDPDEHKVCYFHVWFYTRKSPKCEWKPSFILKVPTLYQLSLTLDYTPQKNIIAADILISQPNKYEIVVQLKPILETIYSCPLEEALHTLSKKQLELYDKACTEYFKSKVTYENLQDLDKIRLLVQDVWLAKLKK